MLALLVALLALAAPSHARWMDFNKFYETQSQLNEITLAAEQAEKADLAAGDVQDARFQEDTIQRLENLSWELADASENAGELALEAKEKRNTSEAWSADYLADAAAYNVEMLQRDIQEVLDQTRALSHTSYSERLNGFQFAGAIAEYGPMLASAKPVGFVHAAVRSRIDRLIGEHPMFAAAIEFASLIVPLAVLLCTFAILRRGAIIAFSVRSEALLLGHLYWSLYFLTLAVATACMNDRPPLVAYAMDAPDAYGAYQLGVALLMLAYITGLCVHVYQNQTQLAGAQFFGALVAFVWVYATVTYPAISSRLPPTVGAPAFAAYALIFGALTALIRKERKCEKAE